MLICFDKKNNLTIFTPFLSLILLIIIEIQSDEKNCEEIKFVVQ